MEGGGEGGVRRDEKRGPLKTPAWEARETAKIEPIQEKARRVGSGYGIDFFLVPVSFTLTGKMADEFLHYSTF